MPIHGGYGHLAESICCDRRRHAFVGLSRGIFEAVCGRLFSYRERRFVAVAKNDLLLRCVTNSRVRGWGWSMCRQAAMLAQCRSGSSELLRRTYRPTRSGRRIGCIGDWTELSCAAPRNSARRSKAHNVRVRWPGGINNWHRRSTEKVPLSCWGQFLFLPRRLDFFYLGSEFGILSDPQPCRNNREEGKRDGGPGEGSLGSQCSLPPLPRSRTPIFTTFC